MAQDPSPSNGGDEPASNVTAKFADVLNTIARGLQNYPAHAIIFGAFIALLLFIGTFGSSYVTDPLLRFVLVGGAFLLLVVAALILYHLQNEKEQNMLTIKSLYDAARKTERPEAKKRRR